MQFLVFRRTDRALVIVPAYQRPPAACLDHGSLRFAGVCDIALHDFVPGVGQTLRQHGYASIREPDWDALAEASCLAEIGDE
ncbi:hypothetical protein DWG18_14800 [Lysobacter sp. TY2-98]|uniref:hypothetical protein n=1 Tax=Lysobacter sp. TY2-98 TaxID=2290922 RepID=UPI000E202DAB|nr:hypothetical protein [Lysobacter sp. TY2-98]AXK73422.1 hypothetical protein DWG18_14800 [Lysobacter sp. TY2-98]